MPLIFITLLETSHSHTQNSCFLRLSTRVETCLVLRASPFHFPHY
jgi:hypothetical protein